MPYTHETYKGYQIRHYITKDGESFNRYSADIFNSITQNWEDASFAALDDEILYREIDIKIEELNKADKGDILRGKQI